MSTTEQLKRTVAPAKARAAATAATTAKTGTMLDIVRSKSFQAQMALALPKSMTAERLTRIVMTECRKVPALMQCNQESFFGAVLQCAQLGLEPGSALGHCYLLPFGNGKSRDGRPNCQLIIGYRGMIDLARRSGQIVSINAYCVHEADEFEYELGLHPDIHHRPSPLAVRVQSKAGKSGPWVTHWEEMARKTVVRKLFKYLPVSIEAVRAVEIDEKSDRGEAVTEDDFIDTTFVDKGQELEPVTPQEEPEVIEQTEQEPSPSPAPARPDIPDEAWVKAYAQGTDTP